MGSEKHCRDALQLIHGLREALGREPIKIAGCLVANQYTRSLENRPTNRQPLLLPARKSNAVLANRQVSSLL